MWNRPELFYCSNVHQSEALSDVQSVLDLHIPAVKHLRALSSIHSGLWLSNRAAGELLRNGGNLDAFQEKLASHNILLSSLNGFPYGDFHSASVKDRVYQPDWAEQHRLDYTVNLARILAACMTGSRQTGSISTLPLGVRHNWSESRHEQALRLICTAVRELVRLQDDTGHRIRLCLEMEPGCVLEHTGETLRLFRDELPAVAQHAGLDEQAIANHLGVCFDVCHQAVMFEDPYDSLQRLHRQGIAIGKIQLSSALEVAQPESPGVRAALAAFQEQRYLHQVVTVAENGRTQGVPDLPEALESGTFPRHTPWRIHFHLPVQLATLDNADLGTTQHAIGRTLDFLADTPELQPHLEVETYTWEVLPEALRPRNNEQLYAGLAAELDWVEQQMQQRGLLLS